MPPTPPIPTLDYRSKAVDRPPLFEFRRSTPPINDLLGLIRIALLWITLYWAIMAPGIGMRFGPTWYIDYFNHRILLMQMHPNYAERLDGILQTQRPEFVSTILYQGHWPYAQWIEISPWLVIIPWLLLCAIIWRITRARANPPAESRKLSHPPRI